VSVETRARRATRYWLLLGSLALPCSALAAPTPKPPEQPRVDYTLHASLDHERHQLTGRGVITLHNSSQAELANLYVHLYLNAFKSPRSLFFRSHARARSGQRPERWGEQTVTHFGRVGSDENLWPQVAHSPDDPEDETDILVPLPTPIAAGERAQFRVEWTSELPSLVERTGFKGDFHFMGQWFPKLAKLEPDGTWAHFAFHPHAEFYANFGDYEVTVDVDEQCVVGASGALERETSLGFRKQLTYRAQGVHDFAWTAWPGFETRSSVLGGVRVHNVFPPGFGKNVERSLSAVELGLRHYGARYGPYPYADLTVVHPPDWAGPAGGMEYPGLITTNGPWYSGWLSNAVEQVTLHELGHQWFYGMLASNEAAWPFLDEGLTSFAEARALQELLGPGNAFDLGGIRVGAHAYYRYWGKDPSEPIAQAASDFTSFFEIGKLVYSRTATLLETLARVHPEAFERALADYTRQQRFSHPDPEALLGALERHLGPAAAATCRQALFERGDVDFAVHDARSTAATNGAGHEAAAVLTRRGLLEFDVDVVFTHEDGSRVTRRWDGRGTQTQFSYEAQSPLVSVVIDPELRVLLDGDLSNNSASTAQLQRPPWHRRLIHWLTLLARVVAP
jgi:Peptidase family M1 domain